MTEQTQISAADRALAEIEYRVTWLGAQLERRPLPREQVPGEIEAVLKAAGVVRVHLRERAADDAAALVELDGIRADGARHRERLDEVLGRIRAAVGRSDAAMARIEASVARMESRSAGRSHLTLVEGGS